MPREAGPYVFFRQCDTFDTKSEKFWCATEKSTQLDWQAHLFCRATRVLFCVCWFNYLNMWESLLDLHEIVQLPDCYAQ